MLALINTRCVKACAKLPSASRCHSVRLESEMTGIAEHAFKQQPGLIQFFGKGLTYTGSGPLPAKKNMLKVSPIRTGNTLRLHPAADPSEKRNDETRRPERSNRKSIN